jgi:hypothetical protein
MIVNGNKNWKEKLTISKELYLDVSFIEILKQD